MSQVGRFVVKDYMADGLIETKEWTANQRKFMEWLALPSMERTPPSQRAFAEHLGVHEVTLCKWHNLDGFKAEVQTLIMDSMGDDLHDVMYAFKGESKKGSFQHQKMYFEMLGLHKDRMDLTSGDEPIHAGNILSKLLPELAATRTADQDSELDEG